MSCSTWTRSTGPNCLPACSGRRDPNIPLLHPFETPYGNPQCNSARGERQDLPFPAVRRTYNPSAYLGPW